MTKRQCGECSLCCKLVPVRELGKGAGQRCEHQRRTGCRVYHKAGMPRSCAMWSCLWLTNPFPETHALSRPDRSHCVIDLMPDFVIARDDVTGAEHRINCIQIWVDPSHREAWREPSVLAFMEMQARQGICTLIRYGETEALTVFAPQLSSDGKWNIARKTNSSGRSHTAEEIFGGQEVEIQIGASS